mmetsp:Transcript_8389/g.14846  ORF Transcript_8389/g.14846 Transcript_8389/m.14846 type:complete len:248 (-) Transcript_8389:9-752(-)
MKFVDGISTEIGHIGYASVKWLEHNSVRVRVFLTFTLRGLVIQGVVNMLGVRHVHDIGACSSGTLGVVDAACLLERSGLLIDGHGHNLGAPVVDHKHEALRLVDGKIARGATLRIHIAKLGHATCGWVHVVRDDATILGETLSARVHDVAGRVHTSKCRVLVARLDTEKSHTAILHVKTVGTERVNCLGTAGAMSKVSEIIVRCHNDQWVHIRECGGTTNWLLGKNCLEILPRLGCRVFYNAHFLLG